jgi:hypothetical protein
MKTRLVLIMVALLAGNVAHGLIDMTPGGFSANNRPPIWVWLVTTQTQIAGVNIFGRT